VQTPPALACACGGASTAFPRQSRCHKRDARLAQPTTPCLPLVARLILSTHRQPQICCHPPTPALVSLMAHLIHFTHRQPQVCCYRLTPGLVRPCGSSHPLHTSPASGLLSSPNLVMFRVLHELRFGSRPHLSLRHFLLFSVSPNLLRRMLKWSVAEASSVPWTIARARACPFQPQKAVST
jgi:hypothetical protein